MKLKARKTKREYDQEHELFLLKILDGIPELVIMKEMNLSRVQYERHLKDALFNQEVTVKDIRPQFAAIPLKSLPIAIQKLLVVVHNDELIRVTKSDRGVFLDIFSPEDLAMPREAVADSEPTANI